MNDVNCSILFEPLVMKNLTLKNRFFMAPMGHTFDEERLTAYLVARARGEVGMITTGVISVDPGGGVGEKDVATLETDAGIGLYEPLVRSVRDAGAAIIAQLNHAGRYAPSWLTGRQPVAPSAIPSRYTGEMPRELTTMETDALVEAFAESALRARKAGFDGIEFCGCSGYLISQFLSPLTNRRTDIYGGDVLGRGTFLLAILKETRRRVGDDFNVCVKFDAEDGLPGGKTLDDSRVLAPAMVAAGADRLHVWAGWHEATRPMLPMSVPRGAFTYLARAVKEVVDVPVATVGRINDPAVAADILNRNEADLIGLGRPLLSDPEFVRKTREGRSDEIRRCTACCYCFDQLISGVKADMEVTLRCSINPELGREGENLLAPTAEGKRVVVAGGGPAGLEAARVAALRGHRVTLLEQESRLGGMLQDAVVPPHKEELRNIIDYYTRQMELLSVDVRTTTTATAQSLREAGPDVLILAPGAMPYLPEIPGIATERVVSALDVLRGRATVKGSVAVIGGGMIGLETGELLAERGHAVTVLELLAQVGSDVGATTRWVMLSRIRSMMSIRVSSRVVEITGRGVVVETGDGNREELTADTVVIAAGLVSCDIPWDEDETSDIPRIVAGSGRTPGQIAEAVAEGFEAGCRI